MWGYGPGSGYGMMGGYGYGMGPIGMIIWVVILIAIVVAVVWLVRSMTGAGSHSASLSPPRRSAGLDVLEERYAKGEINRDEYLEKKRDIGG
jgi:putative membrane protein